ncbi:MAG: bifunctional adenosylcobinamide kinase/adenosylcobinamide-phosphate guanylyltransferase [Mycobacteriaceae bacterium]|nr:bifunctional adenosylcobinamide kinase/adenosylcobinamide-phosphate guanylyltransferase [Mycobacteriaceae bacterium]
MRTLVLGGIRSGKSRWAELAIGEAVGPEQPVRYLATGQDADSDDAWAQRVAAHRERRPSHWSTIETADVATELRRSTGTPTLVDDLGGWLTAVLDRHHAWSGGNDASVAMDVEQLFAAVNAFGAQLVMVSPEVGLSVVPANAAGLRFADELGRLNQRLATVCERVVLVIAGQPMMLKEC